MNYDNIYTGLMSKAFEHAKSLNFNNQPRTQAITQVSEKTFDGVFTFITHHCIPALQVQFAHEPYWGNMCLPLSAHMFGMLNAVGIEAEMVYGDVVVHRQRVFDTSLEQLKHEYNNKIKIGVQEIHSWVTIGGNIVIDIALSHRLIRDFNCPRNIAGDALISPALYLAEDLSIKHEPMLVGSDFFKKTNSFDPRDLIQFYSRQ